MNDAPGIAFLERAARRIRATCVQMAHDAKVGHVGSALSTVEAIVALADIGFIPKEFLRRHATTDGPGCAELRKIVLQQ